MFGGIGGGPSEAELPYLRPPSICLISHIVLDCSRLKKYSVSAFGFRFLIDFDTRIATSLIQSYVDLKIWKKCKNGSLIRCFYRFSINFDTRIDTSIIQISYVESKIWQKWELNSYSLLVSVSINFKKRIDTSLIQISYVESKIWQKWEFEFVFVFFCQKWKLNCPCEL
jgi:hypothetical protein